MPYHSIIDLLLMYLSGAENEPASIGPLYTPAQPLTAVTPPSKSLLIMAVSEEGYVWQWDMPLQVCKLSTSVLRWHELHQQIRAQAFVVDVLSLSLLVAACPVIRFWILGPEVTMTGLKPVTLLNITMLKPKY